GGASVAMPRLASSQARGSLQVTATVVQTQGSVAGLQAAHEALIGFVATGQSVPNDVTTVAQVQVVPDVQTPGTLVVEIDYLKNLCNPSRCFNSVGNNGTTCLIGTDSANPGACGNPARWIAITAPLALKSGLPDEPPIVIPSN